MKTFVELLLKRSQEQPDQTAFIFLQDGKTESGRLTYGELHQKAREIALELTSWSQPGDRILLLYPPGLEFITAFCGCLYAQAIAVPTNLPHPKHSLTRVQTIVNNSQAKVALTTASVLAKLKRQFIDYPDLMKLHWLTNDQVSNELAKDSASQYIPPQIEANAVAFLQYTSGSTSEPKGVMVSHQNLLHNSAVIQQAFELHSRSVSVSWLPHFHDMGLVDGILQPLYTGFLGILMSPITFFGRPIRWLQLISRYQATHSGGPNFAYQHCLRKITPKQCQNLDLSSWESAYNGAEPIRPETIGNFTQNFKQYGFRANAFYPCYGLAEGTLMVTGGKLSDKPHYYCVDTHSMTTSSSSNTKPKKLLVSCGYPRLNSKIIIVDPYKLCECQAGEIGEIWVSSASVAQGYWQQPEVSKRSFQAYTDSGKGSFLRTGDLGLIKEGQLLITGRLKELIIINGLNYYPQDIENTVTSSHSSLRPNSGAVFSILIHGQEKLVIVQEVNHHSLGKLNIDEITGNICQAVMQNHELSVYDLVLLKSGKLPKTSSGKIQRQVCRSKFLQGTLHAITIPTHPALGKTRIF